MAASAQSDNSDNNVKIKGLITERTGETMTLKTADAPKVVVVLSDDTKVPIRVEVRDKQYKPVLNAKVQARFLSPDGSSATLELSPKPLEEGIYEGEWTAEKAGSYVTEIIAGHETEQIGHDVVTFRREDGAAENFHTSQNKELLQKLTVPIPNTPSLAFFGSPKRFWLKPANSSFFSSLVVSGSYSSLERCVFQGEMLAPQVIQTPFTGAVSTGAYLTRLSLPVFGSWSRVSIGSAIG